MASVLAVAKASLLKRMISDSLRRHFVSVSPGVLVGMKGLSITTLSRILRPSKLPEKSARFPFRFRNCQVSDNDV
jgi:hypothetical protein